MPGRAKMSQQVMSPGHPAKAGQKRQYNSLQTIWSSVDRRCGVRQSSSMAGNTVGGTRFANKIGGHAGVWVGVMHSALD
jgi:hypothetical protein